MHADVLVSRVWGGMSRRIGFWLIPLACMLLLGAPVYAGVSQHTYADLGLSPDGEHVVAFEADDSDALATEPHKTLVVRRAANGAVEGHFDPCPDCRYRDPTYAPDGKTLVFMGHDVSAGTTVLYSVQGTVVKVLASIKGIATRPRWSPDGSTVALLAIVGAHKEVGATQAAAPQVGEIGDSYDEQRIAVIAAAGGELRFVSPDDTFVYEYDWTPDGKGFVVTAAKGDGDNNWWVATLNHIDLESGATRLIAHPDDQLNYPLVSPDGRQVAFIGGLMSDFGSVGGDVYLVPITGGMPVNITPNFKGTFTSLAWRAGRLYATALIREKSAIVVIDVTKHTTDVLMSAPITMTAGDADVSFDARGIKVAAVVEDFTHAPEIAVAPVARLSLASRLTHDNVALEPAGEAQNVEWVSEGRDVQGWLLAPKRRVAQQTYPMIVEIHGGPGAASTPTFPRVGSRFGSTRQFLDNGYFVFLPNPRGSYGQGEAFTRANYRDFGGGDLRDILAGIDAVEKVAPVDDQRLGVFGHSYGGFMTMWTVTHTDRFHAAVAGAGVANWISYYSQNGIDQWMIPFFGASPYDDPQIYRALSPLETIKQAHTPTFIYVGERDVECPAPQSVEFWHALKAMGVPTKLLILEGEGHGIRNPAHVKQLAESEMGWFNHYLQPTAH